MFEKRLVKRISLIFFLRVISLTLLLKELQTEAYPMTQKRKNYVKALQVVTLIKYVTILHNKARRTH